LRKATLTTLAVTLALIVGGFWGTAGPEGFWGT
jgi:hypothetical protein